MMEFYESDLSLFGGDLLAGLSSPVDADTDLPDLLQDGCYQVDVLKPQGQAPAAQPLSEPELSPLSESSFQSVEPASGSLFDNRWLDVNTDLLDLLEESQPEDPLVRDDLVVPLAPVEAQHHGSTALQILQSMAEETQVELSASPTSTPTPPPAPESHSNTSHFAGSSVLMGMLLEGLHNGNNAAEIPADPAADEPEPIILGNYMNVDVDEQLVLEASLAPILSPVSPEDVESLLSSGPCSPSSAVSVETRIPPASLSFEATSPSDGSEYIPDDDSKDETWLPSPPPVRPVRSRRPSARSAPYEPKPKTKLSKEAKQEERKLRKKQQNRDAALRYRHKKKQEGSSLTSEVEMLESRNRELNDQADQLAREIKYLKDLMADVNRARKSLKVKPKK